MLLELGMAAAAAYGADKLGLINVTGAAKAKRGPRSSAPVPSAQNEGQLVAPSLPGHVIPAPSPIDLRAKDANGGISGTGIDQGLMKSISDLLVKTQGSGGQGSPYVDQEGYWRDFSSGALYQFHDPNTGGPIGRPGYMPLRYQAYAQSQDAAQAAAAAAAGADPGADPAAVAGQVVQTGLQVAGTVATVAAAASDAGATAATVAGVAGSILACLGPLPLAHEPGWHTASISMLRAYDGDRSLQVSIADAPDDRGTIVLAIEVAADAALALVTNTAAAAEALYADHRHEVVGVYARTYDARWAAEEYVRHWRARRADERDGKRATSRANACGCEGIEAR